MAFGKSGRPPEDRLARQREIFEAVAPLILRKGARRLSMSEAAAAACMSIGGLYHYFPNKRDLVLHAIRPEAIARCCQDFHTRYAHLAETDMAAYADKYFEYAVRNTQFFRPAIHAALELGGENIWEMVTTGMAAGIEDFANALRRLAPDVPEEEMALLRQVIRQVLLAAILDKSQTPEKLEEELRALVARHTGITRPEELAEQPIAR